MHNKKVWFITGASHGLGLAFVKQLLRARDVLGGAGPGSRAGDNQARGLHLHVRAGQIVSKSVVDLARDPITLLQRRELLDLGGIGLQLLVLGFYVVGKAFDASAGQPLFDDQPGKNNHEYGGGHETGRAVDCGACARSRRQRHDGDPPGAYRRQDQRPPHREVHRRDTDEWHQDEGGTGVAEPDRGQADHGDNADQRRMSALPSLHEEAARCHDGEVSGGADHQRGPFRRGADERAGDRSENHRRAGQRRPWGQDLQPRVGDQVP